ncbi:MAG: hypothetical protein HZA68_20485 [Rhodovulum sp.]|nr:hypothetical protein [Rhodovulum sp.]
MRISDGPERLDQAQAFLGRGVGRVTGWWAVESSWKVDNRHDLLPVSAATMTRREAAIELWRRVDEMAGLAAEHDLETVTYILNMAKLALDEILGGNIRPESNRH